MRALPDQLVQSARPLQTRHRHGHKDLNHNNRYSLGLDAQRRFRYARVQ